MYCVPPAKLRAQCPDTLHIQPTPSPCADLYALPRSLARPQLETVERSWLPHIVDSGNFYHILSEILPTFFANWCKFVGVCHYQDRQHFQVCSRRLKRMGGRLWQRVALASSGLMLV
jgi:hypothetical protein